MSKNLLLTLPWQNFTLIAMATFIRKYMANLLEHTCQILFFFAMSKNLLLTLPCQIFTLIAMATSIRKYMANFLEHTWQILPWKN